MIIEWQLVLQEDMLSRLVILLVIVPLLIPPEHLTDTLITGGVLTFRWYSK